MVLKRANIFLSGEVAGFRTFIKSLANSLGINGYADSKVEDIQTKYEEYIGEFLEFEWQEEGATKKATLDDLLKVMISIDNKVGRFLASLEK